jgi:hypothetical protein
METVNGAMEGRRMDSLAKRKDRLMTVENGQLMSADV